MRRVAALVVLLLAVLFIVLISATGAPDAAPARSPAPVPDTAGPESPIAPPADRRRGSAEAVPPVGDANALQSEPVESTRPRESPDTPESVAATPEPTVLIVGVVVDESGRPAAHAQVLVVRTRGPHSQPDDLRDADFSGDDETTIRTLTNAEGRYALTGPPSWSSWAIQAWTKDGRCSLVDIDGPSWNGEPVACDLVVRRAASLTVRVRTHAGRPAEDPTVSVDGAMPTSTSSFDDEDWVGAFENLTARKSTLTVRSTTHADTSVPIDLATGGHRDVTVILEDGGSISGTVFGPDDRPVQRADVWISSDGSSRARAETDDHGRFVLEALADDSFEISASAAGGSSFGSTTAVTGSSSAVIRLQQAAVVKANLELPDGHELDGGSVSVSNRDGHMQGRSGIGSDLGLQRGVTLRLTGPVELRIAARGFRPVELDIVLTPGSVTDLGTIALEPGRPLTGRVTDDGGTPVAGAYVFVEGAWGGVSTKSDEAGRFGGLVSPGAVNVDVSKLGFVDFRATADAAEGAVHVVLQRGHAVEVQLVDSDGRAVLEEDLEVRFVPDEGASAEISMISSRIGRLRGRLLPSAYRCVFVPERGPEVDLDRTILVTRAGPNRFELVLPERD